MPFGPRARRAHWVGGLADRLPAGLPIDGGRSRSGLGVVLGYLVKEGPFLALLLLGAGMTAFFRRRRWL